MIFKKLLKIVFGYKNKDDYFKYNPLKKHYTDGDGITYANIDLINIRILGKECNFDG